MNKVSQNEGSVSGFDKRFLATERKRKGIEPSASRVRGLFVKGDLFGEICREENGIRYPRLKGPYLASGEHFSSSEGILFVGGNSPRRSGVWPITRDLLCFRRNHRKLLRLAPEGSCWEGTVKFPRCRPQPIFITFVWSDQYW